MAREREETLKAQDLGILATYSQPSPQPMTASQPQRLVDRRIVELKDVRFSQDSVKSSGPAATSTLVQAAARRPPSEAISLSELPRAPSLEVPLQSLPPPPRTKGFASIACLFYAIGY